MAPQPQAFFPIILSMGKTIGNNIICKYSTINKHKPIKSFIIILAGAEIKQFPPKEAAAIREEINYVTKRLT
jgi:hypothetical protein